MSTRDRCTRPAKQHKWELERETDNVLIYRCAFCLGLRYRTRSEQDEHTVGKWKHYPAPMPVNLAVQAALKGKV